MSEELFNEITKWQAETFPVASATSKIIHLDSEVAELFIAVEEKHPDRRLEFADAFFLLFGAAHADGMSYADILAAIKEKFEINKARTWGEPDENGVSYHIKK